MYSLSPSCTTNGKWFLAPAYDLTNDQTLGEHATTINIKGLPSDEDIITVGRNIRISRTHCLHIYLTTTFLPPMI